MKTFELAPILTTMHDRLLCPLDEYRAFLNYMLGTNVPLWEVARARHAVADQLKTRIGKMEHGVMRSMAPPQRLESGGSNRYVKAVAKVIDTPTLELKPLKGTFEVRKLENVY